MGTADRLVAAGRFAAVCAVRHQPLPAAGAAALPGGRSCCSAGSLAHDARGCIAATCRSGPPGIEAVKQVTEKGHSVAEVAARLGTTTHSLYAWIKRYDPQQPKTTESSDPSTELAKLKKELQRVTEERDILKKAAVYFASQSK